ncbi:hypothetical protein Tph_c00380 [Thermacetogenium phaeum DSM 12270]|uniref:DUF4446 domain-containing protein n=1 Tax=Thermacetogenium phaeum (strain ATCC BAA-254 / DSM 26808 / PB) TaxID=1089553 RepID=K4LC49_THEPS|nr:DUF4446 family protein [Thermacetogenium phaeum]AFV10288.1 hypothetical protein Tph_c00380 [Thermacetogenium phaeum DSM 12270]
MDGIPFLQGDGALLTALGALSLLCLLLIFFNLRLLLWNRRLQRLLRGGGESLDELLRETLVSCREAKAELNELRQWCRELEQGVAKSLRRVGFLRFNAFSDKGSELSFALALLNNDGDGIVLCCLVGRDDCRLFAKPVVGGTSPYPLSDEEKAAIRMASRSEATAAN